MDKKVFLLTLSFVFCGSLYASFADKALLGILGGYTGYTLSNKSLIDRNTIIHPKPAALITIGAIAGASLVRPEIYKSIHVTAALGALVTVDAASSFMRRSNAYLLHKLTGYEDISEDEREFLVNLPKQQIYFSLLVGTAAGVALSNTTESGYVRAFLGGAFVGSSLLYLFDRFPRELFGDIKNKNGEYAKVFLRKDELVD